jgi:hypothetical protein
VEAIAIVTCLVALGALALRFGHDSRDRMRGKEEQYASYGMTWDDSSLALPVAEGPVVVPEGRLGQIARGLSTVGRTVVSATRGLSRAS